MQELEAAPVENRRSPRIAVARPVTLSGTDASGIPFRETTAPIDGVSCYGARLSTSHRLGVGAQVTLGNPLLGESALARVVRVVEKGHLFEIGVELAEPRDFWGLATSAPSRDPGASSTAADRNGGLPGWLLPERLRLRRRHRLQRSEVELEESIGETVMGSPAPDARTEPQDGTTILPEKPEAMPDGARLAGPERPGSASLSPGQPSAGGAGLELESVQRFLDVSRREVQKLLVQTQELHRQSWRALESSFAEMQEALRNELEEVSRRTAEEARRHVQRDVTSALEIFQQQAHHRLEALVQQTLTRSQQLQQQAERTLEAYSEEQRRLSESGASALEQFRLQSEAWLQSLREDLQRSHDELKVSGMNRLADQLRETMEQLSRELQERAEAAFAGLEERLKNSQVAIAGECEQRILRAVQQASSSAEGCLKEGREQLDSYLQQSLEAFRGQLGEVAKSALRDFRAATAALMGDVHTRLDQAARAFAQLSAAAADLKQPLE